MKHGSLVVAAASLAVPALAQTGVTAVLVANAPIVVSWTDAGNTITASQPPGALLQTGSVEIPNPGLIQVSWTPPTATDAACRLHYFSNPYPGATDVSLDCTLWLSSPNAHGHVQIDMLNAGDFPGYLTVDVMDDGVIEATSALQAGSWPAFTANLNASIVLTGTPVPVRMRMTGLNLALELRTIEVRFVPWATGTEDLGSSCTPNRVFPYHWGPNVQEDYFLAALPGTGSEALRFVADGYGTLETFVVSLGSMRLYPGTIGLGFGCDDLLAAPLLDGPGISLGSGRWALPVPPLPGGLEFFVQHVSLGASGGIIIFGVTNVVRYQT